MIIIQNIIDSARIMLRELKFRWLWAGFVAIFFAAYVIWGLFGASASDISYKEIRIKSGMSVREIAALLEEEGLIRSQLIFKLGALVAGKADRLRPGLYLIQDSTSLLTILNTLVLGGDEEVTVTIPDGSTIFYLDALLAKHGVIEPGALLALNENQPQNLEGYLFPDTYRFVLNSGAERAVAKMREAFEKKAAPFFPLNKRNRYETLIMASLLEKEVPNFEDRRVVAGILRKRLRNNWPLQVDATICYAKEPAPCYPLQALDLKIDSLYNTYINYGLPPTPIGNPGLQAIRAALAPKESPYWYYLSDPHTKKTIFGSTLEEHAINRVRYLQ